jgi:(1->4)-alpha-D-glucan 1-alpha-D-glucosylmutase
MPQHFVATYRVQLRQGFGFDQATAVIPYLAALGISHVYLSPCFRAAPGSAHGYDVTDPNRVDEAIGGEEARARFLGALATHGLGHIVDLVPNHMSVASDQNLWWWDVLEKGQASPHAATFDVEWEGPTEEARSKVLMPILTDHYGRVLEARQIQVVREPSGLTLSVKGRRLPLAPESVASLLSTTAEAAGSAELEFFANGLRWLSSETNLERRCRHQGVIQREIAALLAREAELAARLDARIEKLNTDNEALDELTPRQYYRLAHYRIARYDLDYRRFFDIQDLAALSMHDPGVFHETHALVLEWIKSGQVDGVRIDHPDGLRDPGGYFRRLRAERPGLWIVAEKILQPRERLPEDWEVDGTTGYEFLNEMGALFVDKEAEPRLNEVYREFLGGAEGADYKAEERGAKRLVLDDLLAAELRRLTRLFQRVCASKRRHRDFAMEELRRALREVIVFFPVYRTYLQPGSPDRHPDVQYVRAAVRAATESLSDLDTELLAFLEELLSGHCLSELEWEFVARFQQLTAAAMAKGIEDTAFYRYTRLVSLNEVGGDPARFGTTLEEFHRFCTEQQERWPLTLVAATTHDTKRSQDARLRVSALSEFAEDWAAAVRSWSERARPYASRGAPDPATEYLIWQTLIAAHPISEQRLLTYLEKAMREAKVRTSWLAQNPDYENAVRSFARGVLSDSALMTSVDEFVNRLLPVAWRSSLSETLIQLTACGVPDIYQGSELWDTRLTDPDNRQPVNFDELKSLLEVARRGSPEEALSRACEGIPKLWLIQRVLAARKQNPAWFGPNALHEALQVEGAHAQRVVAYQRGPQIVAIAPRLWGKILERGFGDTRILLPAGHFRNVLDPDARYAKNVDLERLLSRFPVALLVAEVER